MSNYQSPLLQSFYKSHEESYTDISKPSSRERSFIPIFAIALSSICVIAIFVLSFATSKPWNTQQIIFINDIHIDGFYDATSRPSENCHVHHDNPNQSFPYGQYGCDPPEALFTSMIAAMKKAVPSPSLIIFAGDSICGYSNYTEADVVVRMKSVNSALKTAYPSVPLITSLGNNEFPNDYGNFSGDNFTFTSLYPTIKDDLSESEAQSFLKGGYYFRDIFGVRFIVMNTVMYASKRWKDPFQEDPHGQFAWLEPVLSEAKTKGLTTSIIAHIPPAILIAGKGTAWQSPYVDRFRNISAAHPADFMLCGHSHMDLFYPTPNNEGTINNIFLSSEAMTPNHGNNPGFRVYQMKNSKLIDYFQYYTDLMRQNEKGGLTWELEYQYSKTYGAEDLTQSSLITAINWIKGSSYGMWAYINAVFARYIEHAGFYYCLLTASSNAELDSCRQRVGDL